MKIWDCKGSGETPELRAQRGTAVPHELLLPNT